MSADADDVAVNKWANIEDARRADLAELVASQTGVKMSTIVRTIDSEFYIFYLYGRTGYCSIWPSMRACAVVSGETIIYLGAQDNAGLRAVLSRVKAAYPAVTAFPEAVTRHTQTLLADHNIPLDQGSTI